MALIKERNPDEMSITNIPFTIPQGRNVNECRDRGKKFPYKQWCLSEARQCFCCLRYEFPLRKLSYDTRYEHEIIRIKIPLFD